MTEQELLKLKKDTEAAKTAVSELTGQQTAILKQLKDDWQCKDVIETEKMLEKMQSDIDLVDQKIETGVNELKEKYQV
jgi:hypothetical protein